MGWVEQLRASLQARRDLVVGALRAAGIDAYRTEGTYFAQFDARSMGYDDGVELCRVLATQAGVVAIPSVALYHQKDAGRHLVRLALCKNEQTLALAVDRLAAYAAGIAARRDITASAVSE